MLRILDYFLGFLHIVFTLFNLLGWIWPKTRKIHLITIALTAASWFILGIWYGWGYCFLTDWEWSIKEKLGERNLPSSFIKYFADKVTGDDISPPVVSMVTLICFLIAVVLSLYLNFRSPITTKRKAITYLGRGALKYFDGADEFYIDTNNLHLKTTTIEIFWKDIKIFSQARSLQELEKKRTALKVKALLEQDGVDVIITPALPGDLTLDISS